MSSSEFADSRRFAGQKSNFSQTCNLLSQYLKEKGSLRDLGLGIGRNFETNETMNLLPMIEKSGENADAPFNKPLNLFPAQQKTDFSVTKREPERAQMTIFYAGQVIVFNDFPADKAQEIMHLASKGNLQAHNGFATNNMVQKPAESSTSLVAPAPSLVPNFASNVKQEHPPIPSPTQPIACDLPIARKASLARFLEKRKDRLTAKAPYQKSNSSVASPTKPGDRKTWLGLGAQSPLQIERQL